VDRLARELSDHLFDVMEDSMSTDAQGFQFAASQMGMPQEVAATAANEYRQQRFSSRHPVLMFVVLPIFTLPVLWAASFCGLILAIKGLGLDETFSAANEWATATTPILISAIFLVTIAFAAFLYSRLAAKAAVSWKWTLGACVIFALIGGTAFSNVTLPKRVAAAGDLPALASQRAPMVPVPGQSDTNGSLTLGFGVSQNPSPQQMLQFALPLAIGGWAIYRQSRLSRPLIGC
jgi:hypothetical protein